MATIITKNSQTASAVPSAASLSVGELAVNTADGKLYTEHTGGVVKEIIPSTVVDNGITTAKIANANVTIAKLSATGTPGSGNFLRGDGSWQPVTVDLTSFANGDAGQPRIASVAFKNREITPSGFSWFGNFSGSTVEVYSPSLTRQDWYAGAANSQVFSDGIFFQATGTVDCSGSSFYSWTNGTATWVIQKNGVTILTGSRSVGSGILYTVGSAANSISVVQGDILRMGISSTGGDISASFNQAAYSVDRGAVALFRRA